MRKNKFRKIRLIIISLFFMFLFIQPSEAKFINTFLVRFGGNSLIPGNEIEMAKYDIIFANKFHYDDIGGDSWKAIKSINPATEIYLYTTVNYVRSTSDDYKTISLSTIGRYNVSRKHSQGSCNIDNPNFFLKDLEGKRVTFVSRDYDYLLDFGNSNYRNYAIETTVTDHVDQPWTADGVISDHMWAKISGTSAIPIKYDTDDKWSTAMNGMASAMTSALSNKGQKFACNRGGTYFPEGVESWRNLDNSVAPPNVVWEEAAFAVKYGDGDTQYFPEHAWKRQIDIIGSIKNSKVCFLSSTDLKPEEKGVDNYGNSITFWDSFWFTLSSYLIGKNDKENNSYFQFYYGSYNDIDFYYDEYIRIDLGKAISGYNITNHEGVNIYWREFEKGYVYVNPTIKNSYSIVVPELCKQRTHENLEENLSTLENINTINLEPHRAAILYKSNHLALLNAPKHLIIVK